MQRKTLRAAAIGAALLAAMAATALADSKDYEFQLVDKEVKTGRGDDRGQARPQAFRPGHSRCGDLRQAHRHGPGRHGDDGGAARAGALDEPGVYRFKTNLDDGGQLGLVARRQGAGRDRHGREQADRQGDPMSPLAQGDGDRRGRRGRGGSRLCGRADWADQAAHTRHDRDDRRGAARRQGPVIYYRDPDGKPFYSLTPRTTDDGTALRGRPCQRGCRASIRPSRCAAPMRRAERKIIHYRNPMGLPDISPVPKKDSMGMDYIPVYEGERTTAIRSRSRPAKSSAPASRPSSSASGRSVATSSAPGVVALDERRVSVVAPRFDGFIDKVGAGHQRHPRPARATR